MTDRRIALLRGINVGRAKRIAMADLRTLVEDLGYQDVRTVLNSGNVIFTAPAGVRGDAARRIEEGVASRLKISSRVIVLTAAEVDTAVRNNPLQALADNPSRLLMVILAEPATRSLLVPLTKQNWAPEAFALGTRVAYIWCPVGVIDSPLAAAVGRLIGDAGTMRNLATMTRLQTLTANS